MGNKPPVPDAETLYAPTALPPSKDGVPDAETLYGGVSPSPPQSPQGVMGAVGAALQAQPGMMADALTNPVTQAKALPPLATAAGSIFGNGGATIGNVGGNLLADAALASYGRSDQIPSAKGQIAQGIITGAAEGIPALIKVPESLKSAGVNATTLEHMAPGGQAPGDYADAVEQQLKGNGVLAKTANETWKLMSAAKDKAGAAIGNILQQIKSASSGISNKFGGVLDPTVVDATTALKPLAQAAENPGQMYAEEQVYTTPFQEANTALMNTAQKQGGNLTLENIEDALQRTGKMMNKGPDAVAKYGPVYGRLADVRDGMIETIGDQSGNPQFKSDLLEQNANYSTYMRLLPAIEKSGYREAVKQGVSAFQKYGGPLVTKVAAGVGIYDELKKAVGNVIGE